MKLATKEKTSVREPLIKISKRTDMKVGKKILLYAGALVLALAVGAVLIAILGVNPFVYLSRVITLGLTTSLYPLKNIEALVNIVIPLLITALGLALAFKIKFWNIGGEGQFIMAVIGADAVGLAIGGSASQFVTLLVMFIVGGICGGLYALIAGLLKVRFGTNETLLTLMLNYIALYFLLFLKSEKLSFFRDINSTNLKFQLLPENAWIPLIKLGGFSLNVGLIIAMVIVVAVYFYLGKTKHGYEINVVGDSPSTARYAGMKVKWIVLRTVFLSGMLIGIAGVFRLTSAHIMSDYITNDVGWTGIIVAWLSKFNPFAIIGTTFMLGILEYGPNACPDIKINSNVTDLLQGLILFVILASDFFIRYKVHFNVNIKRKTEQLTKDNENIGG